MDRIACRSKQVHCRTTSIKNFNWCKGVLSFGDQYRALERWSLWVQEPNSLEIDFFSLNVWWFLIQSFKVRGYGPLLQGGTVENPIAIQRSEAIDVISQVMITPYFLIEGQPNACMDWWVAVDDRGQYRRWDQVPNAFSILYLTCLCDNRVLAHNVFSLSGIWKTKEILI